MLAYTCTFMYDTYRIGFHVCSVNMAVKNQAQMMVCTYMGQWQISHSNTCIQSSLNGPFEIFIGPLQVLISLRIISINNVKFG